MVPKIRQVLCHVRVEVAKSRRVCHRDRAAHSIGKGGTCLVIADPVSMGSKNYCPECARAILEAAQADLDGLKRGLGLD